MPPFSSERSRRMHRIALPRLRVALRDVPAAALATVLLALAVAAAAMILAASPERSADAGMPTTLRGVWQAPPTQLRLYPRGSDRCMNLGVGSSTACYTLGSSATGVADEWGRLSVDGDELTLTGRRTRHPASTGGASSATQLRLTKLHDPVSPARGHSWPRRSGPCTRHTRGPTSRSGGPRTPSPPGASAIRSPCPRIGSAIRVVQPTDSLATRIAAASPRSRSWRGRCRPARPRSMDGDLGQPVRIGRMRRLTTSGASTSRASG